MKTPPSTATISRWLKEKNPLDLFRSSTFTIRDIDPKAWSGHFNYLITVKRQKLVLRFKGPEWGTTEGIIGEYEILRAITPYAVAPRVLYFTKDFFGEPMLFEEYLDGKLVSQLSATQQKTVFPEIARLIARINAIPVRKDRRAHRGLVSYTLHKKVWKERLKVILKDRRTKALGLEIKKLLPRAETMLDSFEPRLARVLKENGPSFVFESSHIGHCLLTKKGLRFINWEHVGYGDPSYTLAVFLASIAGRKDFLAVRKKVVAEYLVRRPVPEFDELITQRLKEREVSNLIWSVWTATQKEGGRSVHVSPYADRLRRVRALLA